MDQIACSSHPGEICPRIPHSKAPHPQCHTQEQIPLTPVIQVSFSDGNSYERGALDSEDYVRKQVTHDTYSAQNLVLSPGTQEMVQSIMIRNHNLRPEPTALFRNPLAGSKKCFFFVNHPDDIRP
jgi:hypothetical protein